MKYTNRSSFVLFFVLVFSFTLAGIAAAQLTYNNPNLPHVPRPQSSCTICNGSGGGDVSSVSSGDDYIIASPTTGDVVLILNETAIFPIPLFDQGQSTSSTPGTLTAEIEARG